MATKQPKTARWTELPRFTPTKRNLQNYIYAELGALEMWEKMIFGVSLWFKSTDQNLDFIGCCEVLSGWGALCVDSILFWQSGNSNLLESTT